MQLMFILTIVPWMVLNQLTIDKGIHSFIFGVTVGVCLLLMCLQEVKWAWLSVFFRFLVVGRFSFFVLSSLLCHMI